MSRFISFLRAINAGPRRSVKMELLRRVFESLHFADVATFLGSGNVVFRTSAKNAKTLERRIEKGLRHVLGYEVAAFVRTDTELAQIVNCRQFRISEADGRDFNIIFLADPLSERLRCKLMALKTDTDEFKFTDGKSTGCVARSTAELAFPVFPLKRRSVGRLQLAGAGRSKRWH